MLYDAIRLRPKLWQRLDRVSSIQDKDVLRTTIIYFDHLVRIGSLMQGALAGLHLTVVARLMMKPFWKAVIRNSLTLGAANILAYACRYSERIGLDCSSSPMIAAENIFQLTVDPQGKAIIHRDMAERLAELAKQAKTEDERMALLKEALDEYETAYDAARRHGDNSLMLKVLIGRRLIKSDSVVPLAHFEHISAGIQGIGYRRMTGR